MCNDEVYKFYKCGIIKQEIKIIIIGTIYEIAFINLNELFTYLNFTPIIPIITLHGFYFSSRTIPKRVTFREPPSMTMIRYVHNDRSSPTKNKESHGVSQGYSQT